MQAGGAVVTHFGVAGDNMHKIFGGTIVLLGAVTAIVGYQRFRAADAAIRRAELPDIGRSPLWQTVSVVVVSLALILVILGDIY